MDIYLNIRGQKKRIIKALIENNDLSDDDLALLELIVTGNYSPEPEPEPEPEENPRWVVQFDALRVRAEAWGTTLGFKSRGDYITQLEKLDNQKDDSDWVRFSDDQFPYGWICARLYNTEYMKLAETSTTTATPVYLYQPKSPNGTIYIDPETSEAIFTFTKKGSDLLNV